ncbi:MAG: ABC transporter permease [Anaerolineales bacterium]|nr:ABC transporter permease [Anaerolineales bacterium]
MLIDIAFKNLWQRRLRTILTILGIVVAVQLYLSIGSIMRWYDEDLQGRLLAFGGKVYVQRLVSGDLISEDFPSSSSSIDTEMAQELLGGEGVDPQTSSLALFVTVERSLRPFSPPLVIAVGIQPGHEGAFLGTFAVSDGAAVLRGERDVILGRDAALHYGSREGEMATVGETIVIAGETFTVIGLLEPTPTLFASAVLLPLETAQRVFDRQGTVSAVILTAREVGGVAAMRTWVETTYPALSVTGQEELAQNVEEMYANMRLFFNAINTTIILVAIVVIMIVMVVAVMERRREIGTLRAIGARKRVILGMIVTESLIISLIGVILALPASIGMNQLAWGSFYPSEILLEWLRSFGIAIAIGVLASLLPALQAMRVDPLESLRYE